MAEEDLTDKSYPRRRFLAYLLGALSAIIGAVLAIPLAVFSVVPAFNRPRRQWLELGEVAQVPVGKPVAFTYRYHKLDGYLDYYVRGTAYVLTEDRRKYLVLSNVCTHAGCGVRWEESKNGFYCPCHNGLFDREGNVKSGPPPRPLSRFLYKVTNGKLYIELKEG